MKDRLPGTVMFIFQPAEEGPADGEKGGAELMLEEGALREPEARRDLRAARLPVPARDRRVPRRRRSWRRNDTLRIVVKGRQTHGAMPWAGVDPIVLASQIVLGAADHREPPGRTSRSAPAIVTIGAIHGGVRHNIIPDSVEMIGTIRTFDDAVKLDVRRRITETAEHIAMSAGGTAEVTIEPGYPVTANDPALTERMLPTLRRVAGDDKVILVPPTTTSEDFSYFQKAAPGMFVFLGVTPPETPPDQAAPNHSPLFFADERALPVGVRLLANLAVDYLTGQP